MHHHETVSVSQGIERGQGLCPVYGDWGWACRHSRETWGVCPCASVGNPQYPDQQDTGLRSHIVELDGGAHAEPSL